MLIANGKSNYDEDAYIRRKRGQTYMWLEWSVTLLGLLYVVLIAREIRFGWIIGTVGSALFVISNIQQQLYMDSMLNSYYVVMGIYGWLQWGKSDTSTSTPISKMNVRPLFILLVFCMVMSLAYGIVLNRLRYYPNQLFPYTDAIVTTLSFLATWMAARKYIENWLLWLVANPIAIGLYAAKYYPANGWWLYPGLFLVYTFMSAYGYYTWKKDLQYAS